MSQFKDVVLEDLEQFLYICKRGSSPSKTVQSMIENNQELTETREYLIGVISLIEEHFNVLEEAEYWQTKAESEEMENKDAR